MILFDIICSPVICDKKVISKSVRCICTSDRFLEGKMVPLKCSPLFEFPFTKTDKMIYYKN